MNNDNKSRIEYLDVARGIAMISIVLGHLGLDGINRIVFTYHIPIFFLISGYFISEKQGYKLFFIKKIRTLIIPYIFACFLVICSGVMINIIFDDGVETKKVIKKWFLASIFGAGDNVCKNFDIEGIGALWFLLATFWGILILKLLLKCDSKMRVLMVAGLFGFGIWSAKKICWFPFSIQPGLCSVLFMYIGFLIKRINDSKFYKSIKENKELKLFAGAFAVAVWVSFVRNFQSFWIVVCDYGRGFIDIISSLCGCYVLILVSRCIYNNVKFLAQILSYFGKYSVVVLTAHIIELNTFPWWRIIHSVLGEEISNPTYLIAKVICKFIWVIGITNLMTRMSYIKKIYGINN